MKFDLSGIDPNFKVETQIEREGLTFHSVFEEPFEINGIFYEQGRFRRMPEAVARTVNNGVYELHDCPAGGRLRFKTDSPYIALSVQLPFVNRSDHFALTGSTGFDLYIKEEDGFHYFKTFRINLDEAGEHYEQVLDFTEEGMREVLIHFPTYSKVSALYVGLKKGASVEAPAPYRISKPVVYYGSSITQGGCCSRPGNTYQSILSRWLDCDQINLGFSGSAWGEQNIADYIATLDMSVFVMDYDHNAPTLEHLQKTHRPMFETIRRAQPDLPIVLMNRPNKVRLNEDEKERKKVILATFAAAKAAGDTNVYFVGDEALTALCGEEGTVDGLHPTDFGFYSMAKGLEPVLREILK